MAYPAHTSRTSSIETISNLDYGFLNEDIKVIEISA